MAQVYGINHAIPGVVSPLCCLCVLNNDEAPKEPEPRETVVLKLQISYSKEYESSFY
ncbi:hypothetical protein CCACVL1_10960 [Corchorus capsularis]|uniref:Uncharacterized protein n=1 Tax=Corchorus capsularis TaxID=210143 RepID=A0A1R3INN2_COCAP|nr:hypothetical protein CCACVL1_10960 [Corchorus capsularis]